MAIPNFPGWRHLEFDATGSSVLRSAVLKSLTLKPNMKWIG